MTTSISARAVKPSSAGKSPANSKWKTWKRDISIGAAVLLALLAGGWLWSNRTPSPKDSTVAIAKFVATDKFAELPSTKQQQYLDALEKDRDAWRKLPDEQRRAAWENIQEVRERAEVEKYAKMSPAEKQKYLDSKIAEEEARRKSWQERAATRPANGDRPGGDRPGGGGPGGRRGGGNQEARQKSRFENRPPELRAQSAQMRADMQLRRAQLGITTPPGGGRGGGGGRGK